ncbi:MULTISPECIES: YitT family protein [unclassified Breznakia]|uniref:YitT family protein n=1 Tax=unclassified Breznakia TaxID=2623764 RepID=UPI0024770B18|nr:MULTISPECIES: YitT family protein [unclassified Breznakia]MDH6366609.1 uncharacterized membrane-anchored protein YitT (DUF2179 family) [Breznakia sp. PH1-1]MDH6403702.1 uncharacterized membrane-anchored protein YitT (DUF2179 family) [Breznakia sp. PF1-11]MDH6411411.1 uncharacterized membrane-anchored protein YitT (DUF2179 family) [Breznakia sp. PFB1-11]MDH6413858.1 uncharacterized membrane-anchored protein YitT (DUF2179 family) [Breznakia sp. PFB1-14]MDH6416288.1 uncharacterized membrane-an
MSKKEIVNDVGMMLLGNVLLAIGVAFFIVPNDILSGGVAGIAVAIAPIVPINVTDIITILTISLFLIGGAFLGRNFMIKSAFSSILYPVLVHVFGLIAAKYTITTDPILASIYAGVFVGGGLGFVFRTGASTGGMDIPPLIIHKYTNIPVSRLVLITDALTVLLGMSIHGIEPALIGLISVYVSSLMVEKTMLLGMAEAQNVMIVSDYTDTIIEQIYEQLDRGATIVNAKGAYTREDRYMIMVVILKKQLPLLTRIIEHVDPSAFMIVNNVNEVHGEGFTYNG